jgi:hypothetical protein
MPSPETLFDALVALREGGDPLDRRHDARWRTIEAWLRETFPARGPDADEARQETLLAIGRGVVAMEARVPQQAMKWISTIHKRKKIDGIRVRSRDPIRRALDRGGSAAAEGSLVDRLEADGEPRVDARAIERIVETIEEHVEALLAEELERAPAARHLRRLQARATLHRLLLEADFEELSRMLDADEPLTRDRVYKWVERGRPLVLAAVDRWIAHDGEGTLVPQIAAVVRELVEARRADAGVPRPERRGEGDG